MTATELREKLAADAALLDLLRDTLALVVPEAPTPVAALEALILRAHGPQRTAPPNAPTIPPPSGESPTICQTQLRDIPCVTPTNITS